jgi:hypothetical protein
LEDQPWYDGLLVPIRFVVEKRVRGKWTALSSAGASWAGNDESDQTRFRARIRVSKGTYRIRARFADAAHPAPSYSRYRTVVVK